MYTAFFYFIVICIILALVQELFKWLGQLLLSLGKGIHFLFANACWIIAILIFFTLQLIATLIITATILLITVVLPALIIWLSDQIIKYVLKNIRVNLFFAIFLVICTGGVGISLGFWFVLGKLDSLIINSLLLTGIPTVLMVSYLPIRQAQEIVNYKNKQKNLIQS